MHFVLLTLYPESKFKFNAFYLKSTTFFKMNKGAYIQGLFELKELNYVDTSNR